MSPRALAAFTVSLCALHCTQRPQEGGLLVVVQIDDRVKADCIDVAAVQSAGGVAQHTNRVGRKSELRFGVASAEGLRGSLRLVARGYSGPCDDTAVLNAESPPVERTVMPGSVAAEPAVLVISGALDDQDLDGFRSSLQGGVDCDDSDATVGPGFEELCDDRRDNDCNGTVDCGDARCDAKGCDDGRTCSTGERCTTGACLGTSTRCTTAPGPCFTVANACRDDGGCEYPARTGETCLRPDAGGGACNSIGSCLEPGQESNCADGADDDNDGLIDCLDTADCASLACSDGDSCTGPDRCAADGGCRSMPVSCTQLPSACHAGVCEPLTGDCRYRVAVGRGCNDAQACTDLDVCLADAGCVGSPRVCNMPPACRDGNGVCESASGSCVHPPLAGGSCDDGLGCTGPDLCLADGGCAGAFSCTAPACGTVSGCSGTSCVFAPVPQGTICPGGTCNNSGACVQAGWSFVPSNFALSAIPPGGYASPIAIGPNCQTTFDSANPGAGFVGNCAGIGITPIIMTQDGGPPLVVLPVNQSLTIRSGATMNLVGDKPVVIVVNGNVNIVGTLNAGSLRARAAPGAGASFTGCAAGAGTGGLSDGGLRGGGGGGGGFGSVGSSGASTADNAGGDGGAVEGSATLQPLRAGCPGGSGTGAGQSLGGGAVQLSVARTLMVSGVISAGGAGGRGATSPDFSGGGGAGSGGALLLEADVLNLGGSALLLTNGGGGGEGKETGGDGQPGADGSLTAVAPALGGDGGSSTGGDGASGASGTDGGNFAAAGAASSGTSGAGAGGGGVGRIRLRGQGACVGVTTALSSMSGAVDIDCP